MQLIQPLLGDLMFDGIGLAGCVFVLVLIREAWNDWKRARVMRKRRRSQLPYSTGRRRPARSFFREFQGKLVLLVLASVVVLMLVGGRQNPHGDKTSAARPPGTLNPAADNLSSGKDSSRPDGAILTFQTLPPPNGTGGSIANGNSNAIASPLRKQCGRNQPHVESPLIPASAAPEQGCGAEDC